SPTITNSTIANNSAFNGGGMFNENSSPTITNSTIAANNSAYYAGGMYNSSSSPTITNSTITNNLASDGGGMFNDYSSPTITNSTIANNSAIYSCGGMYNYYYSSPTITNTTFANNSAYYAGGMYNYYYTSPAINNSILFGNTASNNAVMLSAQNSTPIVKNSLIEGISWNATNWGTDGGGNILSTTNPFVDAANENYRLKPCSAPVNAGNNTLYGSTLFSDSDLAGNPRLFENTIDMGAYEVQVPSYLTVNLGVDTAICSGTSLAVDAQNASSTYLWNDNSTNQTLAITSAGTYSVIVTDANGCVGKDTIVVTENALPVVNLGADDSYCHGTTYASTLDAQNAGSSYLWNDNSTNQMLSITAAGTYSVIVTDANGCVGKDTIVVTENALPVVNLGADDSYCHGTTYANTLNAQNAGSAYLWNDNSTNQTLTITTTGTYSVIVTDANGCVGKDTIVVTENALPVVSLGADDSYCHGTTYANTLNAQNAGSTYLWNDNSTNQMLTVTTAGAYSVIVTDANGCVGKDTIVVTENALPVVSLGADDSYCHGTTYASTLDAQNAGSSYLWNDNSTNQTLTVTTTGTYSVIVTDANGCVGKDTMVVTENALPTVAITTTQNELCVYNASIALSGTPANGIFSGNGVSNSNFDPSVAGIGNHDVVYTFTDANGCTNNDTLAITVDGCAGLEDVTTTNLSVFPNPSETGVFNIVSSQALSGEAIVVLNALGQQVAVYSFNGTEKTIDLS
ncbi:MAG TPA: choice-of-anchor Q domain-containing protein, partial [Taishania sp.]|nr:choice-of-anchor Q domain-containing protein [Taishania sp.]